VWDIWIIWFVIYTILYVPFDVAFNAPVLPWAVFDVMVDMFFVCDLFLNFRTTYKSPDDELVLDFATIRNRYLRTWFFYDLLAAVPMGTFFVAYDAVHGDQGNTQAVKLLKVFRLLRIRHLLRIIATWHLPASFELLIFLALYVSCAHWFACIFWAIALLEGLNNSWVRKAFGGGWR
jgi:hypothetical protein